MAKYVDGYVLVVPKNKVNQYKKDARLGKKVWMKHGALDYKECMGEDLRPNTMSMMKHRLFPEMAKAKKGETVWFSFIVFKSKKHRNEVNAKVMKDMEKEMAKHKGKDMKMPFDMKRFTYGGFEVIVE
jgi:alkaline phosphatase